MTFYKCKTRLRERVNAYFVLLMHHCAAKLMNIHKYYNALVCVVLQFTYIGLQRIENLISRLFSSTNTRAVENNDTHLNIIGNPVAMPFTFHFGGGYISQLQNVLESHSIMLALLTF